MTKIDDIMQELEDDYDWDKYNSVFIRRILEKHLKPDEPQVDEYWTNPDFVEDRLDKLKKIQEPQPNIQPKIEPLPDDMSDELRKWLWLNKPDMLAMRDKINEIIEKLNHLLK